MASEHSPAPDGYTLHHFAAIRSIGMAQYSRPAAGQQFAHDGEKNVAKDELEIERSIDDSAEFKQRGVLKMAFVA